ncbi:MAG: hypothetical protein HS109_17575 [Burkholderiales bacterium]|nr:hypothetical protein [Burkholderiales bacterium]
MASHPAPIESTGRPSYARVRRDAWTFATIAVGLWIVLRFFLGPMPQWSSYHDFADTRTWLGIPRAGDVLTNLAILAAGLWGGSIRRRAHLTADERPAFALLVGATILTALGSAYYHMAPTNPTLVWDRLPMTLVMAALLTLLLADRIDGRHARAALAPLVVLGIAGVAWWGVTESLGRGDLLLYGVVRIGTMVLLAVLLLIWPGGTRGDAWLWASFVTAVAMMMAERFDREIYQATGATVSGHNLKHVLAGVVIACMFGWLRFRRPRDGVK